MISRIIIAVIMIFHVHHKTDAELIHNLMTKFECYSMFSMFTVTALRTYISEQWRAVHCTRVMTADSHTSNSNERSTNKVQAASTR
jgi:hypothetical protein